MSLILSVLLQASLIAPFDSAAQLDPASEEDIIVIARRARVINVRLRAQRRNGRLALLSCRIANATGRQEIDSIPCTVAQECMGNMPPNRRALADCVNEALPGRFDQAIARLRSEHRGE